MYKRRPMLVSIDRTLTFMAVSDQNFITEGKRRMTRVVIVAILALPLFSLMLAAQQPQSPGAQHKSTPSVVIITDQDNGKDIDLPAGGTLVIRLKSNPPTGQLGDKRRSFTAQTGEEFYEEEWPKQPCRGCAGHAGVPADDRYCGHGIAYPGIPAALGISRWPCQDVLRQGECAVTERSPASKEALPEPLW
jgi:hypothetical protein